MAFHLDAIEFHGNNITSMAFHVIPWHSMAFHGIPWHSTWMPYNSTEMPWKSIETIKISQSQRRGPAALADTDITFPAATGEIGSVTIGMSCDPLDVRYAMLTDDHRKVLENFSSDQVCPVVPDIHDWERHKALGGDRYNYYGDFDSRSGSSDYDDPRDYREWYDWSDIEVDEGYCDPFREEVGGESVITSCKSGMIVDDAVIAAVQEHGDTLCLSDYSGNIDPGPGECFQGPEVDWTPRRRVGSGDSARKVLTVRKNLLARKNLPARKILLALWQ